MANCWQSCSWKGFDRDEKNRCQSCKSMCESQFAGDKTLECGCKAGCTSGNFFENGNDYLTTIGQGAEQIEAQNAANETQAAMNAAQKKQTFKKIAMYTGGAIGVLVLAWIGWKLFKKFRA